MSTATELLDKWLAAFNDGKEAAFTSEYTPNGVYEEIGTGRSLNPQEATAASTEWRSAFPDARGTIESRLVSGHQVSAEVVWKGTNTGPLNGMPATGKPVKVQAAVLITEEGGKAARIRQHIDMAGMLTQLGVLAAPKR